MEKKIKKESNLEKKLKQSEERLNILSVLSYDVLWEWDIIGGYHKWIGDIDTCLGYEKNEFPRTIEAWENIIHPEDKKRISNKLKEHHEKHIKWHEEYRILKKNGEIRWWEDRGITRWAEDGTPLVMTGVIQDITEKVLREKKLIKLQKQSEERLSILTSLSYDVLWQWEVESNHLEWIGDIDTRLGYEKNEFPRTMEAWENIIHPEDKKWVSNKLKEHHEKHIKWHEEYRILKKNGEIRWWEDRGITRWAEDGTPLVMTGVIQDITEKVLREKDKLSSLAKMGASIAHEFNNPLQGIRNVIEILRDSSNSEKDERLGKIGISEVDRLSKLVNGLMDFYKPTNSKHSLVDVNQSVEIVLTLKEENLQKRSIKIKKIFSDDLPKVEIPEDQLKQVVFNILQNAIDSISTEGQITLTTKTKASHITLEIKDTGNGILKQDQGNIFEPFFSTKKAEKGTGLGLSITYGIIKDWNGDISVKSTHNKGTAVLIKLPIKKK